MPAPLASRRQMLFVLSGVAAVSLAGGCATTDDRSEGPSSRQFADEPFPVRLVDRRRFDPEFLPTKVANTTGEEPGTIVVNTTDRHLYWVESRDEAMRYGIAVGTAGRAWKGQAVIGRKAAWPAWYPTDEMKRAALGIPTRIPPGDDNPLGARALYLSQNGRDTLYRIHGTSEPWTIGTEASSGCIRMLNEDVIALYSRVPTGTKVVVR